VYLAPETKLVNKLQEITEKFTQYMKTDSLSC